MSCYGSLLMITTIIIIVALWILGSFLASILIGAHLKTRHPNDHYTRSR